MSGPSRPMWPPKSHTKRVTVNVTELYQFRDLLRSPDSPFSSLGHMGLGSSSDEESLSEARPIAGSSSPESGGEVELSDHADDFSSPMSGEPIQPQTPPSSTIRSRLHFPSSSRLHRHRRPRVRPRVFSARRRSSREGRLLKSESSDLDLDSASASDPNAVSDSASCAEGGGSDGDSGSSDDSDEQEDEKENENGDFGFVSFVRMCLSLELKEVEEESESEVQRGSSGDVDVDAGDAGISEGDVRRAGGECVDVEAETETETETEAEAEATVVAGASVGMLTPSAPTYNSPSQMTGRILSLVMTWLRMEALFGFGFLVCLDVFLSVIVVAPLRILLCGIRTLWARDLKRCSWVAFDLLRSLCLCVAAGLLVKIFDYSWFYHYIREQSPLKLYVMFNMIVIVERLSGSVNEDIEDVMFLFSVRCQKLACVGAIIGSWLGLIFHSVLQLVKLIILNVSINSNTLAHISLLIAINFTELKSTVFKRWKTPMLFQVSCSDICERFRLVISSFLILLNNTSVGAGGWYPVGGLLLAELVVDTTKHCFIVKNNVLPDSMYSEFAIRLARDVLSYGKVQFQVLDRIALVSRRLGLLPLALGAVFLGEVWKFVMLVARRRQMGHPGGWIAWIVEMGLFCEGWHKFVGLLAVWAGALLLSFGVGWIVVLIARWIVSWDGEFPLAKKLRKVYRYRLVDRRLP